MAILQEERESVQARDVIIDYIWSFETVWWFCRVVLAGISVLQY